MCVLLRATFAVHGAGAGAGARVRAFVARPLASAEQNISSQ